MTARGYAGFSPFGFGSSLGLPCLSLSVFYLLLLFLWSFFLDFFSEELDVKFAYRFFGFCCRLSPLPQPIRKIVTIAFLVLPFPPAGGRVETPPMVAGARVEDT